MEITRENDSIDYIIEGLAKLVLEVVHSEESEENSNGKSN